MRKVIYLMIMLFIAGPIVQSCGSSRSTCKTSKMKMKKLKCWNAKKQKYTRC